MILLLAILSCFPAFAQQENAVLWVSKNGDTPTSNNVEIRVKAGSVVNITADMFENGKSLGKVYRDFVWAIDCSAPDAVCEAEPEFVDIPHGRGYIVPNPMGSQIKIMIYYVGFRGPNSEATVILKNEANSPAEEELGGYRGGGYDDYSPSRSHNWGSGSSSDSSGSSKSKSYGGGGGGGGGGDSHWGGGWGRRSRRWSDDDSSYSGHGGGGWGGGSSGPNTKAWGYNRDNETPVVSCKSAPDAKGNMVVICDPEKRAEPARASAPHAELRIVKPSPTVKKKIVANPKSKKGSAVTSKKVGRPLASGVFGSKK